jgi:hypothetical protein
VRWRPGSTRAVLGRYPRGIERVLGGGRTGVLAAAEKGDTFSPTAAPTYALAHDFRGRSVGRVHKYVGMFKKGHFALSHRFAWAASGWARAPRGTTGGTSGYSGVLASLRQVGRVPEGQPHCEYSEYHCEYSEYPCEFSGCVRLGACPKGTAGTPPTCDPCARGCGRPPSSTV